MKRLKDKMDCYILQTFLLVTVLLFITTIICYHHRKYRSKQNNVSHSQYKNREI